jgi:hypothetical protein
LVGAAWLVLPQYVGAGTSITPTCGGIPGLNEYLIFRLESWYFMA